jgi:hypothetical protein
VALTDPKPNLASDSQILKHHFTTSGQEDAGKHDVSTGLRAAVDVAIEPGTLKK